MGNPIIHDLNSSLPQGWRWVSLGEVCEEIYRYPTYYSIEYVEQGIPEVRGELIRKDGTLEMDLTKYRFISKETSERYSRTILREDDFVLSVRGSMGKVALVPKQFDGANITANLIRISPNHVFVHSPFLKLVFLSGYFQSTLEDSSPQTTIRTIKAPILKSIPVPLPPLPEQKRIAAKVQELMAEVEHAHTACEKQLGAAKALSLAYLRQVFESEETKRWERRRLGELLYVQQGVAMSPKRREGISPHPFLRTLNVLWGHVDLSMLDQMDFTDEEVAKLSLKPGDLLVCEGGEVGRTAIWRGELEGCLYQNHIHRLRGLSDNVVPDFYVYWMQAAFQVFGSYSGQESKTTIPNLSGSQLKSFKVPLPLVEEQEHIASELKDKMTQAEKLKEAIEKQLGAINALPQAILRKAFRGEL